MADLLVGALGGFVVGMLVTQYAYTKLINGYRRIVASYRDLLFRATDGRVGEADPARPPSPSVLPAMAIRARELGLFEFASHLEEEFSRLPDKIGIPRGSADEWAAQLRAYDADLTQRMERNP